MFAGEMSRHTTFRFCLDPTVEQLGVLARHAGAARFAFNECLGMVKTALTQRTADPEGDVPWTGFDLINAFNLRAIRLMPAAGSVSTAAWRHSWSPPTRTAVKSPESRIHPKLWLPG